VQLVPDPAAGAARGERAAPHHQRRLRLLRYVLHLLSSSTSACQCATGRCLTHFTCRRVVAAREGQAGRQDGVDPAQLPGLRQVPHQGQPTTQRCFSISVTTVLLNSIMHVQCTRGYIQSRMRERMETLTEVLIFFFRAEIRTLNQGRNDGSFPGSSYR
jgi:hypothetical protein